MQKLIIISLGLFLIWSDNRVTSNPVSGDAVKSPWENVENGQQKLQPFQLLLANKTLNPFLEDCYSGNCCLKPSQVLCPSYYEMILLLNNSKQLENLTVNEVKQLQTTIESMKNVEDVEKFCTNFSKSLAPLTFQQWNFDIREHIEEKSFCRILCFKDEISVSGQQMKVVFTLKPFCKMITVMAKIIANEIVVNTINNNNVAPVGLKIENNNVKYNGTTSDQVVKSNPVSAVVAQTAQSPEDVHKEIATSKQVEAGNKQQQEQIQGAIENNIPGKLSTVNKSNSDNHNQVVTTPKLPIKDSQMPNVPKVTDNHDQNVKMKESAAQQPPQPPVALNDDPQNPVDTPNEDTKSTQVDKNQEDGSLPEAGADPPKDPSINENKIQSEQQGNGDSNLDINNQFDPDIDGSNIYDDDPEPPPQQQQQQPNIKQLLDKQPKEPTTAEIMEKVTNDILQKTGTNYIPASDPFYEEAGSNFFTYLLAGMFICILLYVLYHNKTKVLALILEGRRSQNKSRSGRRKHTAQYRKLDTNLEEAITSSASGRSTQIIY